MIPKHRPEVSPPASSFRACPEVDPQSNTQQPQQQLTSNIPRYHRPYPQTAISGETQGLFWSQKQPKTAPPRSSWQKTAKFCKWNTHFAQCSTMPFYITAGRCVGYIFLTNLLVLKLAEFGRFLPAGSKNWFPETVWRFDFLSQIPQSCSAGRVWQEVASEQLQPLFTKSQLFSVRTCIIVKSCILQSLLYASHLKCFMCMHRF